ncbi:hypothetical protein ACQW02_25845 [Humitalea sp. 24SJ18S-53]|uniref:hypothetical protein n=1 Tax=Humitalea sp. 24SJ18S-53 TaxID=3422307 RepID=UPI003D67E0C9
MCESCAAIDQAGIGAALLARARAIEAALPGEPVPDQAWRILAGAQGGAVAWAHHRRMLGCLEAAAASRKCYALRCDDAAASPAAAPRGRMAWPRLTGAGALPTVVAGRS